MPEWYETNEKWYPSEYGADDQLGTLNHVDSEKVLSAMKLVKKGKVYRLSHEIYNGMPGRQDRHGPFFYLLSQRVYDQRPPFREATRNKFGAALCRVEMVDHLATHLDALNHIAFENKFYNGHDAFELSTTWGTPKLGIETTPPIVTRGICVDATGGRGMMDAGEPISTSLVERFLKEHNISVEPGDAVFFYTGVGKLWSDPKKYNEFYEKSPGIGIDLAKWLARNKVSVSGSDTPSTEVTPPELAGTRLPVHQYLITLHGMRLIDNINLNEVMADGVYHFLFMLSPLRIRGATASPVSPIAVV
ncbi:MAG TPA: cyclase family protein [Thermoplasmataceae archaeon]|nr:cyclase family protein [Thermoplasmataceae archaeon]